MSSADQQISRAFYELSGLLLTILRPPPGSSPPPGGQAVTRSERAAVSPGQLTPAALVSLLLGMSLALMLCGSVTFVIGFMLMPWVLGLLMVLYFVGIVSSLSGFGRAMLGPRSSSSPRGSRASSKDIPGENSCSWLISSYYVNPRVKLDSRDQSCKLYRVVHVSLKSFVNP